MTYRETEYRRDADPAHPITVEAKRARAGRPGIPVLYVLLWSLALTVLVFLIVWLGFHHVMR